MVEIRRVDAQGSPKKEDFQVFSVEIWTDDLKYHFSFESSFYHCKRTGRGQRFTAKNTEMVEPGTDADLENFGVQDITNFCIEQVRRMEKLDSLPLGAQKTLEYIETTEEPVDIEEIREYLEQNDQLDSQKTKDITERLISRNFLQRIETGKLKSDI